MADETYDIQELVKASGVPRRTIYFYVQQGLLPAPEGAGLAAYYTREHLVRLQLIPVLRQQGLRLDEIRQRFLQMPREEMDRMLADQPAASQPTGGLPAPFAPSPAAPEPPGGIPLPKQAQVREAGLLAERRFIHYQLPAGVSLVAPADLGQSEQVRLRLLLQAAAQIYATQIYATPTVYEQPTSQHTSDNSGQSDSQPDERGS